MKEITAQLIRHDGLRLTPYRCTAGRLTIGVGKNIVFTRIIRAVKENNFETAALEMKDSSWYTRVGGRADTLVQMMKQAGSKHLVQRMYPFICRLKRSVLPPK